MATLVFEKGLYVNHLLKSLSLSVSTAVASFQSHLVQLKLGLVGLGEWFWQKHELLYCFVSLSLYLSE